MSPIAVAACWRMAWTVPLSLNFAFTGSRKAPR